jgi:signal transduction histidine kinase
VLGELIRDPVALRIADVGAHAHSYGFPPAHPPMSSFLGVPIFVQGRPFGNLYLTEKQDGDEFSQGDEDAAVVLAEFGGIAIGYARRFTDSDKRLTQQQHRLSALDATMQIAQALGGETDLGTILELVAKRGRALVSARAVVIELLRGDELEIAACAGELPPDLIGTRIKLEDSLASTALRTGQSQTVGNDVNRARFAQHGLGQVVPADDALVVPLVFRDRAYGALVALEQLRAGNFTTEQRRLLEAFAASAANAVATAQSVAEERRRQRLEATEAERSRWARELHDETLEGLASTRLMLAGAEQRGDSDEMATAIGHAIGQLETEIANLRALIADLRPAALDDLGLEPAVHMLIDRARGRGLDIDVTVDLAYEQVASPSVIRPSSKRRNIGSCRRP